MAMNFGDFLSAVANLPGSLYDLGYPTLKSPSIETWLVHVVGFQTTRPWSNSPARLASLTRFAPSTASL
jgi:hypothetical protein